MVEDLTRRPAAGLSVVEQALLGSQKATEKVLEKAPELGKRPSAGLSMLEMGQVGLVSAQEKIVNTLSNL